MSNIVGRVRCLFKVADNNRIAEIQQAIAENDHNAYMWETTMRGFAEAIARLQWQIDAAQQAHHAQLWGVFVQFPYTWKSESEARQYIDALCEREHTYRLDQMERAAQLYFFAEKKQTLRAALERAQTDARQAVHSLTDTTANESNIIKHAAWASLQQTSLF